MLRLGLSPVGGRMLASVGNARSTWIERRGLLLTLSDDDGYQGLGEASPLPGYSPDTLAEAERDLRAAARRLPSAVDGIEAVEALSATLVPSARFALETAWADLLARRRGSPLLTRRPSAVLRSGLLSAPNDEALSREARSLAGFGLRHVKLKVGGGPIERDVARVAAVRGALGPEVGLRLDANGAFEPGQLAALCGALAPHGVELIEEPTGGAALASLGALAVPWAADESLVAHADALLANPHCFAFVLKPATLGLLGALRLGQRALAQGKRLIVTHCFDGPVALAACCELALALAGPSLLPCGLDLHPALGAYPPWAVPQLRLSGLIAPAPSPGLGLDQGPP